MFTRLNPYSNGSTTMGAGVQLPEEANVQNVLILILMEVPQWEQT